MTRPPALALLAALAVGLAGCAAPPAPARAVRRPVVALMTDFGLRDDAVGLLRGVVLDLAPDVQLVDLTHEVPAFDVAEGSRLLADAPGVYPAGTVFCVVVDPGVGTARRAIVARLANGSLIVAPDNGVITDAALQHGLTAVRAIETADYLRDAVSATFHGRDVFAPVAGHLAAGRSFEGVGPLVEDWVRLERPRPSREGGVLRGRVIAIDEPFGNVWTDIPAAWLEELGVAYGERVVVAAGGRDPGEVPYVATFGDVPEGAPLLYRNSRGKLALALNMGDLARARRIERGAEVTIRPAR